MNMINEINSFPVPKFVARNFSIYLGIGMIFIALWISIAPISGAVIAEGTVKIDGSRKTIQHQEGGIIKKILVKNGDHVHLGQALVLIEDVRNDSNFESLLTQLMDDKIKIVRLEAERNLQKSIDFFDASKNFTGSRAAELIARENNIFKAHRKALDTQIALLQQQINEVGREGGALRQLSKTISDTQRLAEDEMRINAKLQKDGFISETKMIELRRSAEEYQSRVETEDAEIIKVNQKSLDLKIKISTLEMDYVKTAEDELKSATSDKFKLEESLRPLADLQRREVVAAPVEGDVVDLKFNGIGAVIGPREAILDIVPTNTPLIIECHVKPEDIKNLRIGGPAEVRITAYKQKENSSLTGLVTYISADRIEDKASNSSFYVVYVNVDEKSIQIAKNKSTEKIEISAGLQAQVFMQTKSRTAVGYLLSPIISSARLGMREE